jgi:hypothetical protein
LFNSLYSSSTPISFADTIEITKMNGNGHHVNAPQALIVEARPKTYSM